MFTNHHLKLLHFDEALQLLVRPSWVMFWGRLAISGSLILVTVFFVYPAMQLGRYPGLALVITLGLEILYLIRLVVIRQLNAAVITNKRLIDVDQRGLFSKQVTEVELENIQDIRYNKSGILAALCNVGTVVLQTVTGRIEIAYVKRPQDVQDRIVQVQRRQKKGSPPPEAEEIEL